MIVRAAPREHLGYIAQKTGLAVTQNTRAIEAIDASGRIHGMVAYDGWTDNSVQMHVAVETPGAVRALLRPAFSYPFVECGKGVVIGIVRSDNARALALDRHLGFTEVARIRDAFEVGVDSVLMELRREDCRWLAAGRDR